MHDIYSGDLTDADFEDVDNTPHLPAWLATQYEQRAAAERENGGSCTINHVLPTVAIMMSSGEEWFFQEHEATALLDTVPGNLSAEDYLLASAQSW
jgi:hypothetical protein